MGQYIEDRHEIEKFTQEFFKATMKQLEDFCGETIHAMTIYRDDDDERAEVYKVEAHYNLLNNINRIVLFHDPEYGHGVVYDYFRKWLGGGK